MEIIKKYIFESEKDHKILQAVKKYIGRRSIDGRIKDGINKEESELCSTFYDIIEDLE